jgi:hypothetical protein
MLQRYVFLSRNLKIADALPPSPEGLPNLWTSPNQEVQRCLTLRNTRLVRSYHKCTHCKSFKNAVERSRSPTSTEICSLFPEFAKQTQSQRKSYFRTKNALLTHTLLAYLVHHQPIVWQSSNELCRMDSCFSARIQPDVIV